MLSFFDESYYLKSKLAQLLATDERDINGNAYTMATLVQAIQDAGMTPIEHYGLYGRSECLNPNAYFNEKEYLEGKLRQLLSTEPDAQWTMESMLTAFDTAGFTPLEHYESFGAFETDAQGLYINPSNAFDVNGYFQAKLLQVRNSGESVNGHSSNAITMTDVLEAFQSSGLTPVSHYLTYGANEAKASGQALLQTVPVSQRVPNDIFRESLGEVVPGNYNAASIAPESVTSPQPPAKPADVGANVPESISPAVTHPTVSVSVPGDAAYLPPLANLVDTNAHPVVAPTTANTGNATDYWAVVNRADGSASLYDNQGQSVGTLPSGAVDTGSGGTVIPSIPPTPTPDPTPVSFTATAAIDEATFHNGATDVFTTTMGTEGRSTVNKVDISDLVLAAGETLQIDSLAVKNNSSNDVIGAELVSLIQSGLNSPAGNDIAANWTFGFSPATSSFTMTSKAHSAMAAPTLTHGTAEVQSINLPDVSILDPESAIYIGSKNGQSYLDLEDCTVLYTNTTGAPMAGMELIEAILSGPGLEGWSMTGEPAQSGGKLVCTSTAPGVNEALLTLAFVHTEVQNIDLTATTLAVGETLYYREISGTYTTVYTNTTGAALGGTALAEAAVRAGIAPNDWTMSTDGAKLVLTCLTPGKNKDDGRATTTSGLGEQHIALDNITLGTGKSLTIKEGHENTVITYTNSTGATLTGKALATVLDGLPLNGGWTSAVDGAKLVLSTTAVDKNALSLTQSDKSEVTYYFDAEITVTTHRGGFSSTADLTTSPQGAVAKNPTELSADLLSQGHGVISSYSSFANLDTITNFTIGEDRITVKNDNSVVIPDSLVYGFLDAGSPITTSTLVALCGTGSDKVAANGAGIFAHGNEYYLIINDRNATFNAQADVAIKLVGLNGVSSIEALTVADFFG